MLFFGNNSYDKITIYNQGKIIYNGNNPYYICNFITLSIKLDDEIIVYDEKYKITDINNNNFWCISSLTPIININDKLKTNI